MELQGSLGNRDDKRRGLASVISAPGTGTDELSVAILQLTSVDDVSQNVSQILALLATLDEDVPDLICLPENALYFRLKEGAKIPSIALDDRRLDPIYEWARSRKTTLHLGSVPREVGGRIYNASVLVGPDGLPRDVYRKIHLFDVDVVGHKPVRESDVFAAGEGPAIVEVAGWKIGLTICYDLRFAELFLTYAKAGVDLILIPSAFLVPTGRAHWDVLTRARAIECQAYVVAAAQGGTHSDGEGHSRATYGHSIIVDPWGEVVETLPDDFGERRVLRARLSKAKIAKVRAQIPVNSHRRL